jgi:hypothetical protein
MTTTLARMPARHWRTLNWLRDCAIVDRICQLAAAVNEQGATADDLIYLEGRHLIQVRLDEIPISFAEQFGGGIAPLTAMLATTVRLTPRGINLVLDDPNNLVVRTLARERRGRQIRHVKHEAQVEDATLKDMDDAELIESIDPTVALRSFRKLPGDLKIRLTGKGRRYCAAGPPPWTRPRQP